MAIKNIILPFLFVVLLLGSALIIGLQSSTNDEVELRHEADVVLPASLDGTRTRLLYSGISLFRHQGKGSKKKGKKGDKYKDTYWPKVDKKSSRYRGSKYTKKSKKGSYGKYFADDAVEYGAPEEKKGKKSGKGSNKKKKYFGDNVDDYNKPTVKKGGKKSGKNSYSDNVDDYYVSKGEKSGRYFTNGRNQGGSKKKSQYKKYQSDYDRSQRNSTQDSRGC